MQHKNYKRASGIALAALFIFSTQATAQTTNTAQDKTQSSSHQAAEVSLVDEADVQARPLSDWAGDWQSLYPLLQNGLLDVVIDHKAESGQKTAAEYRAYYEAGFKTDVERILIDNASVTFFKDGQPVQGQYADDGYEILTYESGNQGVRFVFRKVGGDAAAPQSIQFSDHKLKPTKADHYHLYWGDDRAVLLKEVTNWPTYFPADLSEAQIVSDMLAH